MPRTNGITDKEKFFCHEYLATHNRAESYKKAYNCKNSNKDTINRNAHSLINKPRVMDYLEKLQEKSAIRCDITADRILKEYAKIAFSNLTDIVGFDGAKMTLEAFNNLTEEQRACIKEFEVKTMTTMVAGEPSPCEYVKVKLHDKNRALDKLGEHLKLFIQKSIIDVGDGEIHLHFGKELENV